MSGDDAEPTGNAANGATSDAGTITRLPQATVERIAAGEVITRPARVVGELIENALDADAERIRVRVAGDGTERIVVADDGHGMCRADAVRALDPHTTSKIDAADDLQRVASFGFRGEALAAITDAARRVELLTAAATETAETTDTLETPEATESPKATRVTVEPTDGERQVTTASRDRGTTVTAEGLFADRPARRESLAGPAREFGRISRLVADYAVTHPTVAFRLVHDDRETLSTPGTDRTDALLAVYDRETAGASEQIERAASLADGRVRVAGRVVHPSITRSDRSHVRVAVNGRPVTNDALRRAVVAGYDRTLAGDEEPIAAVTVGLPPTAVDPNVHPAKRRVALRDADRVTETVTAAVRDALRTADLARTAAVETEPVAAPEPTRDARLSDATVLGQYRETYLLCESGGDLLVVDQHAAHERVTFERLQDATADEPVPTREIDPPATVSLDPDAAAAVASAEERLREAGFAFETFGGRSYRVHGVPAPLGRVADADALAETARALAAGENAREDLLAELACHPSLRAGDAVSDERAAELVDALAACDQPYACPHGRPTVLRIEEATLARGFDRANTRLE